MKPVCAFVNCLNSLSTMWGRLCNNSIHNSHTRFQNHFREQLVRCRYVSQALYLVKFLKCLKSAVAIIPLSNLFVRHFKFIRESAKYWTKSSGTYPPLMFWTKASKWGTTCQIDRSFYFRWLSKFHEGRGKYRNSSLKQIERRIRHSTSLADLFSYIHPYQETK